MANKNFKVSGKVKFCGKSNNDGEKNVVLVGITPEQATKICEAMGIKGAEDGFTSNPIKVDDEDQSIAFKASSKFDVDIYDNGIETTGETALSDIGKDSEVQLFVSIGESKYKGKKYQVAYLKAVNIFNLVPFEKFNAFEDGAEVVEL